jgi:hypothetical protein
VGIRKFNISLNSYFALSRRLRSIPIVPHLLLGLAECFFPWRVSVLGAGLQRDVRGRAGGVGGAGG